MSGRSGGRGGWAGGRGLSLSKEFLKRSAQEAGLHDHRHIKLLSDIASPTLFPDMCWHSSGERYWNVSDESERMENLVVVKRAPATVSILNKNSDLVDRMQRSSHYVRPEVAIDVIRYSTINNSNVPPDIAVLKSMGINGKLSSDERYFPLELLRKKKKSLKRKTVHVSADGELFDDEDTDAKVIVDGNLDDDTQEEGEDDEHDDIDNDDEGEEEEGEDYTTNYYDSDNDDQDDGDDEEPTYDF